MRSANTLRIESLEDVPRAARRDSVSCLPGSATYHLARDASGARAVLSDSWWALCGAGLGHASTVSLSGLADWHDFRLCRDCTEAL